MPYFCIHLIFGTETLLASCLCLFNIFRSLQNLLLMNLIRYLNRKTYILRNFTFHLNIILFPPFFYLEICFIIISMGLRHLKRCWWREGRGSFGLKVLRRSESLGLSWLLGGLNGGLLCLYWNWNRRFKCSTFDSVHFFIDLFCLTKVLNRFSALGQHHSFIRVNSLYLSNLLLRRI